mgnify:CR=1 FL=1
MDVQDVEKAKKEFQTLSTEEAPVMSHTLLQKKVFPHLNKKTFLMVLGKPQSACTRWTFFAALAGRGILFCFCMGFPKPM